MTRRDFIKKLGLGGVLLSFVPLGIIGKSKPSISEYEPIGNRGKLAYYWKQNGKDYALGTNIDPETFGYAEDSYDFQKRVAAIARSVRATIEQDSGIHIMEISKGINKGYNG